jgi:amino acid transporter
VLASRPVSGLADRSPVYALDRRRLAPGAVFTQSVGSIAPAAAASITPAATIAAGAGGGAVWSALLAVGVAMLIALAINTFTRRMAAPGSLYSFAVKGLGAFPGFLTGCMLLVGYGGVAMACIVASATYLSRAFEWVGHVPVSPGFTAILALFVLSIVAVVVWRGTRTLWPYLLAVEGLCVAAVLAVSAALFLAATPGSVVPAAPAGGDSAGGFPLLGIAAGVIVSTSGFVGFESGSALGPEARRPFRVVPRVVRWTPILSGIVLIIATAAQSVAFTHTGIDPAEASAPLPQLLAASGFGGWWSWAIDLAVGLSFIACAIASVMALGRLLFALALEGVLPRRLARVGRRFRTPHLALACGLAVVGVVPIVTLALGVPFRPLMDGLVGVGVFGYMLAYLGVCIAAPLFLRRIGELTRVALVLPLIAAGLLAILIPTYAVYQVMDGSAVALSVGCAVGIIASISYAVLRRRRPERIRALGVFDSTSGEDLLWGGRGRPLGEGEGPAA